RRAIRRTRPTRTRRHRRSCGRRSTTSGAVSPSTKRFVCSTRYVASNAASANCSRALAKAPAASTKSPSGAECEETASASRARVADARTDPVASQDSAAAFRASDALAGSQLELDRPANAAFAREPEHESGGRGVLDRDSDGLVERELRRVGAARSWPRD